MFSHVLYTTKKVKDKEAKLDLTRTKPQLNRNVIAAVKNVPNIDMCMR